MQKHKHFETVLTDKDYRILAIGNPVISEGVKDIYINEIIKKKINYLDASMRGIQRIITFKIPKQASRY